jgi:hypothetical protein
MVVAISRWSASVVLTLGLLLHCSLGNAQRPAAQFRVFDGTSYLQKPDLRRFGVLPLQIAYEPHLFRESPRNKATRDAMPPDDLMRAQVSAARGKHSDYFVIDIEAWSVQSSRKYPAEVARSIARHSEVIAQVRRIAPDLKLGLFGSLPVYSRYERLIAPEGSEPYADVTEDNNNLRPLATAVDAIFPVGYTLTGNRGEWHRALVRQIGEARRLNPSVPLFVFLWPRYADYAPAPEELRSQWIDRAYWRYQLDTVRELADGIVLWGGWDPQRNRAATWDSTAPWWHETVDFLKDEQLTPFSSAHP